MYVDSLQLKFNSDLPDFSSQCSHLTAP